MWSKRVAEMVCKDVNDERFGFSLLIQKISSKKEEIKYNLKKEKKKFVKLKKIF